MKLATIPIGYGRERVAVVLDGERGLVIFEHAPERGIRDGRTAHPAAHGPTLCYKANRFSVVGPGADVRWPDYAQLLDYELELACVIGRSGVDITPDRRAPRTPDLRRR